MAAKKPEQIPFFMHESEVARLSKANEYLNEENKRLHKVIVILIVSFFLTIVLLFSGFLLYESKFELVEESTDKSVEVQGEIAQRADDGSNNSINVVGGDMS